jgi:hypothetical protein
MGKKKSPDRNLSTFVSVAQLNEVNETTNKFETLYSINLMGSF